MIHLIGNKHSGHGPDGRRLYFKGGGGGDQVKYDNLERLYAEQAASARLLRGIAEQNLPGATQAYVGNVQNVLAPDYANRQAGMAGADMASANAMERAATERNLASMGVNPNDPRFAGSLRSTQVNNAARMAAGKNVTRNQAEQYQLNVAKDAVGTFTGQSNNAATQMGNAASGLGSVYSSQANQKMAQDQAQANAIGNVANAGLTAYAMFAKDGGKVPSLAMLADGGNVAQSYDDYAATQTSPTASTGRYQGITPEQWSAAAAPKPAQQAQSAPAFGGGLYYDKSGAVRYVGPNDKMFGPRFISSRMSPEMRAAKLSYAGLTALPSAQMKDGGKVNGVGLKKILRRADGGEVRGEDYGYGARTDGTPKGRGYFGELKRPDGDISTELSIGINLGGNETEIPLLVPVLSRAEIDHLLSGGEPTESIVRKAADHAKQRIQAGKSPYAGPGETSPLPAVAGNGTKKIERHMLGGTAGGQQNQGFFQMQSIAPPPVAQAPQQQGGGIVSPATMATMSKIAGKNGAVGTAMDRAGNAIADRVADAYTSVVGPQSQVAQAPVTDAVIKPVSEVATAAPAATEAVSAGAMAGLQEAGLATTAGTVAEGAGAGAAIAAEGGAAAGLMGSVGAALPWVGAAYAVGSLLDWWNEGGKVGTQNAGMSEQEAMQRFEQAEVTGTLADLRAGGRAPGEWVENRDTVPAMLVSGEQVLNSEASKLIGDKDAAKLNKKGLELRKQGKTPKQIKTVGLAGLESMV